jgi:hypothetical protein
LNDPLDSSVEEFVAIDDASWSEGNIKILKVVRFLVGQHHQGLRNSRCAVMVTFKT